SAVTVWARTEPAATEPPADGSTMFSTRWVVQATTVAVRPNRTPVRAEGVRHTQPAAAVPRERPSPQQRANANPHPAAALTPDGAPARSAFSGVGNSTAMRVLPVCHHPPTTVSTMAVSASPAAIGRGGTSRRTGPGTDMICHPQWSFQLSQTSCLKRRCPRFVSPVSITRVASSSPVCPDRLTPAPSRNTAERGVAPLGTGGGRQRPCPTVCITPYTQVAEGSPFGNGRGCEDRATYPGNGTTGEAGCSRWGWLCRLCRDGSDEP